MAQLPADVSCYYVEELTTLVPTTVVFLHLDEIWFNTDRVFDSFSEALAAKTTLRDFSKSLQRVVEAAVGAGLFEGNCLYVRPHLADTRPIHV